MKKKLFAILLCAVISAVSLTACGKEASSDTSQNPKEESLTFDNIDVTVDFGDYEAMDRLSSEILLGRATDMVVQIDGIVSNFAKNLPHSIGEKDEQKGQYVGTKFEIEGLEQKDYPKDGAHIRLTGKVTQSTENSMLFYIYTTAQFIEVLD